MIDEEDLLIPQSVAVRWFNERTGAKCKTLEETRDYLTQHPEARAFLELDGPRKIQ